MFGDGQHTWGGPSGRVVVNIGARTELPASLIFMSESMMVRITLEPDGRFHHYAREIYLRHGERHDLLVGNEHKHEVALGINSYYFSPIETPALYDEP